MSCGRALSAPNFFDDTGLKKVLKFRLMERMSWINTSA